MSVCAHALGVNFGIISRQVEPFALQ